MIFCIETFWILASQLSNLSFKQIHPHLTLTFGFSCLLSVHHKPQLPHVGTSFGRCDWPVKVPSPGAKDQPYLDDLYFQLSRILKPCFYRQRVGELSVMVFSTNSYPCIRIARAGGHKDEPESLLSFSCYVLEPADQECQDLHLHVLVPIMTEVRMIWKKGCHDLVVAGVGVAYCQVRHI